MSFNSELVRGTLETIALEVLAPRAMYGYEICKIVMQRTHGQIELREGSIYPALHKLEKARLLGSHWVDTDEGRRRKYYALTPEGRKQLKKRREEWKRFARAMDAIVEGARRALA